MCERVEECVSGWVSGGGGGAGWGVLAGVVGGGGGGLSEFMSERMNVIIVIYSPSKEAHCYCIITLVRRIYNNAWVSYPTFVTGYTFSSLQ